MRREQQADIARAGDELVQPEVSAAYEGVQRRAKDVWQTPPYQGGRSAPSCPGPIAAAEPT